MPGPMPRGLRLIIGYKLGKALAEVLGGASIFILGSVGLAQKLAFIAQGIRRHATEDWSIALAEKLLDASTAHNVFVVAMAMLADSVVTAIEGWALYRRYVWSRWLVVLTTASLIPFEISALVRHPNAGRAVVLLVNLLIVVYLLKRHESAAPTEPVSA
jgi:uncharacterized membrane protein (DUF2068 family)